MQSLKNLENTVQIDRIEPYAVIDDIDLFLRECDDLDSDFRERYQRTFVPENWGTTPADFLVIVRTRIADFHKEKASSKPS